MNDSSELNFFLFVLSESIIDVEKWRRHSVVKVRDKYGIDNRVHMFVGLSENRLFSRSYYMNDVNRRLDRFKNFLLLVI